MKYFTPQELENVIRTLEKRRTTLKLKLDHITDEYIRLSRVDSKKKKKPALHKLVNISKQRGHLKSKIQHFTNELIHLKEGNVEKGTFLKKISKYIRQMPYEKQKKIFGIVILTPWIAGILLFFSSPMVTTFWWSLNSMTPKQGGGFTYLFTGLDNYVNLFTSATLSGTTVLEMLTSSIFDILIDLPTILIFSLFIAVLLNTRFKGHQLVKALFFIPVVYNMTVINNTLSGTFGQLFGSNLEEGFQISRSFSNFLMQIGIGGGLIEFLMSAVDRIFLIINKSGIQIIMFLAALQAIPTHLYESATVEGATKYEMFWKVTLPMVSPMILTGLVYTIVDSFGSSDIMSFMTVNSQGTTMATNQPGLYSSISIVYFLINILIIVIAFLFIRKKVFYYD